MEDTTFRSYQLNELAPSQIASAAPYPRRVVFGRITRNAGGIPAFTRAFFVATDPNNLRGAVVGPSSIPFANITILAADQALYARAFDIAGPGPFENPQLSVTVSQTIPILDDLRDTPLKPTVFRRFPLTNRTGTPLAAVPICAASEYPLRVVVVVDEITILPFGQWNGVRITSQPNELTMPPAVVPALFPIRIPAIGGTFGIGAIAIEGTATFVLAPGQRLYASVDGPPSTISVTSSELDPRASRGSTGIPGPDGVE